MATYKSKGIILKRTNLGEADRILTILTDNRGKIKVVAKGIRKTLSKLAGHLELFCLADLMIAEGKNLDLVTGAEIVKCYLPLRKNLQAIHTACYLAEIIDRMLSEEESHPKIFQLFEDVLAEIPHQKDGQIISFFEINFLADQGYSPELSHCLKCHQKILPEGNSFSFKEGGLMCAKCQNGDRKISPQAIKVLRLFLSRNMQTVSKIKTSLPVIEEVRAICQNYLKYINQKEFKSERFL